MNTISKLCLPAAAIALSLIGCGGMDKKDAAATGKTDSAAAMANKNPAAAIAAAMTGGAGAAGNSDYAERLKARRAKGDTLAMPYAELEKFLPTSEDGYTAGKPNGASINMSQVSYSAADVTFKKDNGDIIKVSIIDYNQAYQIYNQASLAWSMGMSVDSPNEKAEVVKLDNTNGGWEAYRKNSKEADITLGIGSRFFVKVEATNQTDVDMVKSIAKSIDLAKLASM
jgi:hypothetical protein